MGASSAFDERTTKAPKGRTIVMTGSLLKQTLQGRDRVLRLKTLFALAEDLGEMLITYR